MVINVDISKAKNIHKNELRIKRREKFEALDVLYMKALEASEDTTSIKNKKQQLRDATKAVDNKDTLEEIKAVELPDVGV
tara:strand:+ start:347 stop:586 length:240 start_codon:yes stop_codon:yes gene_type:complete